MSKPKWRGIPTTQKHIHEKKALTIINRLGQKSISLPRIDDAKRLAGFPGLSGTAKNIAKLIPKCKYYVEAFAGAAKVYQELPKSRYKKAILNDKSTFVNDWLKKEFKDPIITKVDFTNCIKKWDSKDTVFLFDYPWFKSFYLQKFAFFDRLQVLDYDDEVLELCHKLKGKFIITTRKENVRMLRSGFNHTKIKSIYPVSGKYPRVLITTNLKV